ncbi:hypothetical protein EDD15DRAFT_2265805 [Pisolithus albus]|nr:hypothetical protein EDD15DRAFT_2265805 [Pisolithus albus]
MATVHVYEHRKWLGWYNSPGSYTVASRYLTSITYHVSQASRYSLPLRCFHAPQGCRWSSY